jgi:hypothetical protein
MNATDGMNSSAKPDDLVLHLVEREGVAVVNVGEKLFVNLLVAGVAPVGTDRSSSTSLRLKRGRGP